MTYLSDWAEKVINRDINCVICGSKQNLEAHHIFKVHNYDDFYLDMNNGITLCSNCHLKYHEKYGLECNIKNLLELKNDIDNPLFGKLKKKYDTLNNQKKQLEKKYYNVHFQMKNLEKKNRDLKKKNRKLRKILGKLE